MQTSVAGVFALGDVRAGSIKRIASAVGEGASATHKINEYLASGASMGADWPRTEA
jgi:thioredoxin reductase (NADPH)